MILSLFWWLLVAHAVCDYPLQGDFLARGKNHLTPIPEVPWWICLIAHSLIHGGAVALITQSIPLGIAEFTVHIFIDYSKCAKWFGFKTDQLLHVICKVFWTVIVLRINL